MPKKLGGHAGPKPLRDADNLLGFAHLDGADLTKVTLANKLYRAAISLLQLCSRMGCFVSVENPARSWLWQLLAMLVKQTKAPKFVEWYAQLESVYFDACAHGSNRDKRTKLLATENFAATWRKIVQETILTPRGNPFKVIQALFFQRQWKRNIQRCCANAWHKASLMQLLCRESPRFYSPG